MLGLVLECTKTPSSFPKLVSRMQGSIRHQVSTFTLDPMLARIEDEDSLVNLGLLKLSDAVNNFQVDPTLTEEHNERRFLAMLKRYIRNEMIDHQYAANVAKRRPATSLVSTDGAENDRDTFFHSEHRTYEIESNEPEPQDYMEANELDRFMRMKFNSGEPGRVYNLLSQGYPPEKIAGKTGINVSRVRYIIYEKIQPRALQFGS